MTSVYDWDLCAVLYHEQQLSDQKIAEQVGCSRKSVSNWRKKHGGLPAQPEFGPKPWFAEADRRLRNGEQLREIAADLGVFVETVRKLAYRRGIQIAPTEMKARPKLVGGTLDRSGYILLRVAADGEYGYLIRANTRGDLYGYAPLHRIRMHDKLGRKLLPKEVVHHIDGDIYNCSPANLEVFAANGEHLAKTLKGRVPQWTEEGKKGMCGDKRGACLRRRQNKEAMLHQTKSDDLT